MSERKILYDFLQKNKIKLTIELQEILNHDLLKSQVSSDRIKLTVQDPVLYKEYTINKDGQIDLNFGGNRM